MQVDAAGSQIRQPLLDDVPDAERAERKAPDGADPGGGWDLIILCRLILSRYRYRNDKTFFRGIRPVQRYRRRDLRRLCKFSLL